MYNSNECIKRNTTMFSFKTVGILILVLDFVKVNFSQNSVINECGTLYYEEPAIAGRNVTLIFHPADNGSDAMTWIKYSSGSWMTVTENWKYKITQNMLIIVSEERDRQFTFYVNYGGCNSVPLQIPLEVLSGCGKLYQRTQNVRLGNVMELGYFPASSIINHPHLYVMIFRVRSESCNDTHGCIVTNTTGMYELRYVANHEYVLRILQLTEAVNGDYVVQCTTDRDDNILTNSIRVIAPVRPFKPIFVGRTDISSDFPERIIGEKGKPLVIKCNVTGGTQPLEVKMFVGVNEVIITQTPSGLYKTAIQNLSEDLHEEEVRCTVTNLALLTPLQASARIYVAVKPSVKAVVPTDMRYDDASTYAHCSCKEGRPAGRLLLNIDNSFNTSIATDIVSENKVYLEEPSREWNGKTITCTFIQPLMEFSVTDKQPLLFKFPPTSTSIMFDQTFSEILPSYTYSISCMVAEAYPQCNVTWNINRSYTTTSITNGLYITNTTSTASLNVTRSDFGMDITCKAICADFNHMVSMPHTVRFPYSPEISLNVTTTTVNVTEGQTFIVKCTVHSYPKANVHWLDATDYSMSSSYICDQDSVCLPLYHVTENQTGLYRCMAKNELSDRINKTVTIHLQARRSTHPIVQPSDEDSSTLMFVTIAIGAAILVLISIIVAIIIRKRSNNKELKEDRAAVAENNNGTNSEDRGVSEDVDVTYAVVKPKRNRPVSTSQDTAATSHAPEKELIYADLDLPNPSEGSHVRPRIIGSSETEYVQIDFSKRAAPLPDIEPTEDTDNIYMNS